MRRLQRVREKMSLFVLSSASVVLGIACVRTPEAETANSRNVETLGRITLGRDNLDYRVDCAAAEECSVAWVSVDCCGSQRALGVRASAAEALEERARGLQPHAGSCECLAFPTRLDDGQSTESPADVRVSCRAGRCMTER